MKEPKKVNVFWNGKPLREVYPHATWFQVFKFRARRFFRKLFIWVCFIGLVFLGFKIYVYKQNLNNPIVEQKSTENELEKIMNEENFKKVTVLRARKVASDARMNEENQKHEVAVKTEKERHDAVLAQIESENEAIRSEELGLVGKVDLK